MDVKEYRNKLHEDIAINAEANLSNAADEFLFKIVSMLSDADEFDDFTDCYYEGVTTRGANMRIDGYAYNEIDRECCIFICDYNGPYGSDSIRSEEINNYFKKIRYFVDEATKRELYDELENSTEEYEFARDLYYNAKENIDKFKFFLITDAYNKQRTKNLKDAEVFGKKVELNVWDINRIFDLANSKTQKESVEIFVESYGCDGIPCVKAVAYENIKADIDTNIKPVGEISEAQKQKITSNIITYSSYLAVVPGTLLNELYLEYGSRLLEGNVRSFLSVRPKVNKGIQYTIKNYPEMFFAYNNGIAATATELDTVLTGEGLKIVRIKDLQIVNGGQTTASIANTLLTLKKNETADISNLYVPMKISVLDHAMAEKIIPKISEYSNSQNKVDASDFFSNHPFHIRIEDYSRRILAPAVNGNQFQQCWYYERTRGQYNQGKMKFKAKSKELRQYETRFPESQVIKLVDLAKYMEIYIGAPDVVSKGKQEIVKLFSNQIRQQWDKSDTRFNEYYFKRVVALAIIFRKTDEIIKQTQWYKEKKSYKANVVAYTMSIIFNVINKKAIGTKFDFMRIWNSQDLYSELKQQIEILCTEVYQFITSADRKVENVTQWCKQKECWEKAKANKWTILPSYLNTLVDNEVIKTEQMEAANNRKLDKGIENIGFVINKGSEYWVKVINWNSTRKILSQKEIDIINVVINIPRTGKIPTDKQLTVVMKARERLLDQGMPFDF